MQRKISSGYNCGQILLILFGKQISVPMTILINQSIGEEIASGKIKKKRHVIPVCKSKATHEYSNYRPVFLLPSIHKILGTFYVEGHMILYRICFLQ